MRDQVPPAYFHGIVEGRYAAVWPVYIVDDDRSRLTFTVAVELLSIRFERFRKAS